MTGLRWILTLVIAFFAGKLISKLKMPAILGWLIAGMILGYHGLNLMPESLTKTMTYQVIIDWMQVAFGLMLGTELVWKKIKKYGKALIITTLTQSLGTFAVVTLAFAVLFYFTGTPLYLSLAFGGIALATAPAPALSIVQEFHTRGPVTDTLLPMAILDDIVGIAVFFTVNAFIAERVSGGSLSPVMIPVMIFLPIILGAAVGWVVGLILRRSQSRKQNLAIILVGITAALLIGMLFNTKIITGFTLNYALIGVSFSAVFSNMIPERSLSNLVMDFNPILGVCLLAVIVDLGAPLDYHLILGAGLYTFIYIAARAFGKYFGARFGATKTGLPETVQKYLGLTLLPHSGVSLVFTGIVCSTLQGSEPQLAAIVKGTIAAAAVINEIIAVIAAKKGFELAGEVNEQ